jgi:16S rRNA (cytosine967-C5)-methyltransferase
MASPEQILARQGVLIMEVVELGRQAVARGTPLDAALADFYRRRPELGSRDRRLLSSVVFAYFRWKGWLDRLPVSLPEACAWAHGLDAEALHPAVVALLRTAGLPEARIRPLGRKRLAEKAEALGACYPAPLAVAHLVPEWIVPLLGEEANRLIESFQHPPPTWLRVRPPAPAGRQPTLSAEELLAALAAGKAEPAPHSLLTSAIAVRRGFSLAGLPAPVRARLEVQDLASQAVGCVCSPRPGETWWDACCGSGGKALHLVALAGGRIRLLATDIRPSILRSLEARLTDAGIRGQVTAHAWNGASEAAPAGPFDGVLLDVPCSGTGTWARNPDARWRLPSGELDRLNDLQRRLIRAGAAAVKPGGVMVYATCSALPRENEAVIRDFLLANREFHLDPFVNPVTGQACEGSLRIAPWDGPCNALFIARFRRAPSPAAT